MTDVTVIDYDCGNLFSVCSAIEVLGRSYELTYDPDKIAKADRLILPGVGAFGSARVALDRLGLVEAIYAFVKTGRPFLGICLGMQLLFDTSEEFGEHDNFAHQFTFYEHNVRVPLLFHRPGLGRRTEEGLMTLMDIGPTLADMAGIDPCSEWCGKPSGSAEVADRDYVLMETFFGGNCLFDHRPFYFGVRTRTHKYIWKSGLDERDSYSPEGPELYDLICDPEEQVNIYSDDHPLIPSLNQIIVKRMMEISEIPQQLIIDAFGLDACGALK